MRFCDECGKGIADDTTFCPYCGAAQMPTPEPIAMPDAAELPGPASLFSREADAEALPDTIIDLPVKELPEESSAEKTFNSPEVVSEETAGKELSDSGLDDFRLDDGSLEETPVEDKFARTAFYNLDDLKEISPLTEGDESTVFKQHSSAFEAVPVDESGNETSDDVLTPDVSVAASMSESEGVETTVSAAQQDQQSQENQQVAGDTSSAAVPEEHALADRTGAAFNVAEMAEHDARDPVEQEPEDESAELPAEPMVLAAAAAAGSGGVILPPDIEDGRRESGQKQNEEAELASAESPSEPVISEQAIPEPSETTSDTSHIKNQGNTDGRKSKQLEPLAEGTVLHNRYEIVRKVGGGGMGAVYLASDRNLGGILRAVKEMVQSYVDRDQHDKAVQDFKRESMLLTSLEHPCIPTIYDYFYDDNTGRFYLVMKYISGGDLAARLRSAPEGKVDEKSVTEWAVQVADVLDYLHNRRPPIIYRDLKPSNLMIDGNNGKVMLIDFGIARWVNKEEKGVTAVGTMGYAPPELFSGNPEPRSDIYSLGATMFHLLTGADPQSNPLLIFDFVKNPRPRQVNPNISSEIERIMMRAVEYNVESRFVSAGEMRDTLMQHLENIRFGRLTYGPVDAHQPAVSAAIPGGSVMAQSLVFCGFCGEKIVGTDVFCPFCGAKQAMAESRLQPAFQQTRVLARLVVAGTEDLNPPAYMLEKENNLVGRRDPQTNIFPEVDLSKFDPQTKISRRHARIWKQGEGFLVEDLGSSNGTTVVTSTGNSARLTPHQPSPLAHGDRLQMGDTTLHFVVG